MEIERYKESQAIFVEGSGEFQGYYVLSRKTNYDIFKEILANSARKVKKNLINLLRKSE